MRDQSVKALQHKFRDYLAIGEAISILLHPFGEVVLHDIESGKVARIWNAFSSRKAGDLSHLKGAADLFTEERVLGPYEKVLSSQGRTKSMTAALYDPDGTMMGFFCVNLDITIIDTAMSRLLAFTETPSQRMKPVSLNDFQQQINYIVRDYLLSANKTIDSLSRGERVRLIGQIDASGLFHARNAIKFVGVALGLSRASIYNLLADAKKVAAPAPLALPTAREETAAALADGQSRMESAKSGVPRRRSKAMQA